LGAAFLLVITRQLVEIAEYLRSAVGFEPPHGRPDLFLIAAILLIPLALSVVLLVVWKWYSRVWQRRLVEVWSHVPRGERKRLAAWEPDAPDDAHHDYLRNLVSGQTWNTEPAIVGSKSEDLPAAVLGVLEREITQRAITTG